MAKINNPTGAFGVTTLAEKAGGEAIQMQAAGLIFDKQVVSVNTLGKAVLAATDVLANLCIGIAVGGPGTSSNSSAIAYTNSPVMVVTAGMVSGVPVDGASTAGAILKRSITTAGSLAATATPAVGGEGFAISLVASASNVTDVWIKPTYVN